MSGTAIVFHLTMDSESVVAFTCEEPEEGGVIEAEVESVETGAMLTFLFTAYHTNQCPCGRCATKATNLTRAQIMGAMVELVAKGYVVLHTATRRVH